MDFNKDVRLKQLDNLEQFITSSKDRVESILDYLGWTADKLNESANEVKCPIDPTHTISRGKKAAHLKKCTLRKEGYSKRDKFLSEPNPVSGSTITIDNAMKSKIFEEALSKEPSMTIGWRSSDPVPRTSDRLLSTFLPSERLLLYDYAIASTSGPPQVPEFNITDSKREEKKDLTDIEKKALERDLRRRRTKYKAKCVDTNRKNTSEITREIINGQMEAYEDWLRHELNIETSSTTTKPNSPVSRHSEEWKKDKRSRSKESDRSKHSDRLRGQKRKKSRERSRIRDRSRSKIRGRSRSKLRERSRSRIKDRSRSKSRNRDRGIDRRGLKYENGRRDSGARSRRYSRDRHYEKLRDDRQSSRKDHSC